MEKFKYHINHFISLLPKTITIASIEHVLKAEHGISRDTFYRDRNLLVDDDFSIPSERLDIYAALLGVTSDELKNYKIKKTKPMVDRKPSDVMQKVIKRTGLIK